MVQWKGVALYPYSYNFRQSHVGAGQMDVIPQLPPACNLETKSQFVFRKPKIKWPATDLQTDTGRDCSICQSKETHQLQTSNCFHH